MNKLTKFTSLIIILLLMLSQTESIFAGVWEFGTSGDGKNPFTPRGFLVDTDKGQHWLSSGFNNSGSTIYYSGTKNGVDYLDAKKSDGSNYTFYAMTDRNPTPGKDYIAVYKNGSKINLSPYAGTPGRGEKVDPSGNGTCWVIPIKNFELESGSVYEFFFQQGMTANNTITLVLAPGKTSGRYLGYITKTDMTVEEQSVYDKNKNSEYRFVESYSKDSKTGEYSCNLIPMRFTVQTYADLSKWDAAADNAQQFIDSVTETDYSNGNYSRSSVKKLISTLDTLDKKAHNTVKTQIQKTADANIEAMIKQLNEALANAKKKPKPADMSKLAAKIKTAEALYNKASVNVGIDVGQYGVIEVENLKAEIDNSKEFDKFYPQVEIDEQVIILQNAMDEVNWSLVEKAKRVFYDKVTGIYVIADYDSLPESATMSVSRIGKTESQYKDMKKKLSDENWEAELFDIRFYNNEKRVYLTANAEVQIPIADTIKTSTSTIFSYGGKSLDKIKSVKSNGIQLFKSTLKSPIVMAGVKASESDKAENRKDKMARLMGKNESDKGDRSDNSLASIKKKKEVFADDPLDKLLKRNDDLASFSKDVKQETNPIYLIISSIALALVAAVLGINAILKGRKEEYDS